MTVSAWLILSAAAQRNKNSKEEPSSEEDEDWVDWTCQQCSDGAIGVGNYYIQRQVHKNEVYLLPSPVTSFCPGPRLQSRASTCWRTPPCARLTPAPRAAGLTGLSSGPGWGPSSGEHTSPICVTTGRRSAAQCRKMTMATSL